VTSALGLNFGGPKPCPSEDYQKRPPRGGLTSCLAAFEARFEVRLKWLLEFPWLVLEWGFIYVDAGSIGA